MESPLRAIRGASERRRWRSMAEDMVVAVSNDEKPVGKTRSREYLARNRERNLHESDELPIWNGFMSQILTPHSLQKMSPRLYILSLLCLIGTLGFVTASEKACTIHDGDNFFDLRQLSAR